MMISSPSAGDRYAADAALDRTLRSGTNPSDDASGPPDDATPTTDSGPDVVVTLSRGDSSPSTYDASGRMGGRPTLDDLGANGPNSMAHASEANAGDSNAPRASTADVDQDAAVAA
ncbi:MAG: hypothetical protein H7276_10770 [Caulobacter sp.]|nr:hypothetical protein [Vitreoscilla sp.]